MNTLTKFYKWIKSIFSKAETVESVKESAKEVFDELVQAEMSFEKAVEAVAPATAAKMRSSRVKIIPVVESVIEESASVISDVVEAADTASELTAIMKKGKYSLEEIATIGNAVAVAGKLGVDWDNLSTVLNRDVKSIKAKAKSISK